MKELSSSDLIYELIKIVKQFDVYNNNIVKKKNQHPN